MNSFKSLLLLTTLSGVVGLLAQMPAPHATASSITTQQFRLSQATTTAAIEQSVFKQINQYRTSRGLRPLTLDARIAAQSRNHSQAMASGRVPLGHAGFQQRVQAIGIPFQGAAENVAYNMGYSDPAKQAVEGWLKSAGHRRNIEGNYNLTGIGVVKNARGEYYFTQIFIRQR